MNEKKLQSISLGDTEDHIFTKKTHLYQKDSSFTFSPIAAVGFFREAWWSDQAHHGAGQVFKATPLWCCGLKILRPRYTLRSEQSEASPSIPPFKLLDKWVPGESSKVKYGNPNGTHALCPWVMGYYLIQG